jgi:hypothetical protein
MQVDEPPDHLTILSTPPSPIPPPNVVVLDQAIDTARERLAYIFNPGEDETEIRRSPVIAWAIVQEALSLDLTLRGRLANDVEFRENVKRNGQEQFMNLLRDTAWRGSWRDFLKNGTFLFSFDLRCSDHVPWLEIFVKQNQGGGMSLLPASLQLSLSKVFDPCLRGASHKQSSSGPSQLLPTIPSYIHHIGEPWSLDPGGCHQ